MRITRYAALAAAARSALLDAAPGSDHQLAWAHTVLGSARSDDDLAVVAGLLDGSTTPDGLAVDDELRWSVVQTLSAHGRLGVDEIEAELDEEAWIVVPAEPDDVFSDEPDGLWSAVLRRQGGPLALLATMPPDPSLN